MNHVGKKRLLAAALIACVSTAASAADGTPTLGQVLKASGLDVSGFLDLTYTNFDTDTPQFIANTTQKDSFNVNAADIAISSLPDKGFGGMVEVLSGDDVAFNAAKGFNSTTTDLLQAYFQYAGNGFTAIAGKYATLAGVEVQQAPDNTNISRSLLYTNAIPGTHTGVRANFTPSDGFRLSLGLNNGWDVLRDSDPALAPGNCIGTNCADGKTLELGVGFTPNKVFGLTASYYSGEEAGVAAIGTRTLFDAVLSYNASDALTLMLNVDQGDQDKATAGGTKAKWSGVAGYANYALSEKWRTSLRVESFDDKQGFRTGTVQKLKEFTVTVGYKPVDSLELRGEVRGDKSDQQVYTKGGAPTDKQTFLGVEAVYTF